MFHSRDKILEFSACLTSQIKSWFEQLLQTGPAQDTVWTGSLLWPPLWIGASRYTAWHKPGIFNFLETTFNTRNRGWGDGSDSKVLIPRAWGSEVRPLASPLKARLWGAGETAPPRTHMVALSCQVTPIPASSLPSSDLHKVLYSDGTHEHM